MMVVDDGERVQVEGVLVHRFSGHDGPIDRPCTGAHCVYCADVSIARSYLSFWRRPPDHRCRSQTAHRPGRRH